MLMFTNRSKRSKQTERTVIHDDLLDYVTGGFDYSSMATEDRIRFETLFNRYRKASGDVAKKKIDRTAYQDIYNEWMAFVVEMDIKYHK